MPLSEMYTDYALTLHTLTAQSAAAIRVDGIIQQSLAPGLVTGLRGGQANPYPTHGSLDSGTPTSRVTTTDLKALLDEVPVAGMKIDQDGTHPGVVHYFAKHKEAATREALDSSLHTSVTVQNGIMVLRSLTLPNRGTAQLVCECIARQASAVAPLLFDEAADLPAAVYPVTDVLWTLGKLVLNATEVDGLESIGVDFGVQAVAEARDSDIYPTLTSIRRIVPGVVVRTSHLDTLATLTEDGAYYTATQVVFYARKRAEGATFVADGTTEHIKFTLGKCRAEPVSIEGDPKVLTFRLTPWYTPGGSPVLPVAIDTASAIT